MSIEKLNLKIKYIKDLGKIENERLVINVLKDDDIGLYGVFCTKAKNGDVYSNKMKNAFWFPDKETKTGDLVVLYTKNGNSSIRSNSDGTTSYFYYWGLNEPIWDKQEVGAVLFKVSDWMSYLK